jgi:ketosteroid isomerase-like protein
MSQENVEIARRMIDAWNRRDLEAILGVCAPEVEFVNSPSAVEAGTRRGLAEGAAVIRTQWEIMLDARQETDQIYDRGDEVIVLGRASRRMPGSEARIEDRFLTLFKLENGSVTRVQALGFGAAEVQEALEAARLPE